MLNYINYVRVHIQCEQVQWLVQEVFKLAYERQCTRMKHIQNYESKEHATNNEIYDVLSEQRGDDSYSSLLLFSVLIFRTTWWHAETINSQSFSYLYIINQSIADIILICKISVFWFFWYRLKWIRHGVFVCIHSRYFSQFNTNMLKRKHLCKVAKVSKNCPVFMIKIPYEVDYFVQYCPENNLEPMINKLILKLVSKL